MSLACDIRPTGSLEIGAQRVDRIGFYNAEGMFIGSLCLGGPKGDVLFVDGVEVSICQEGDPPQLRLATRDQQGVQMGGVVQGCALRLGEDVHENLAQVQIGGKADDAPPGTYQGSLLVKVRTNMGPDEDGMQTGLAITPAYEGRIWGGLPNSPGNLGKHANAGDDGPYICPGHGGTAPTPGPEQVDTLWAPDGSAFTQQQGPPDFNFVTYTTSVPFSKAPEHVVAIFDAVSTVARLTAAEATLRDYDARLDRLERKHRPPGKRTR
jgi:hypothetical protein